MVIDKLSDHVYPHSQQTIRTAKPQIERYSRWFKGQFREGDNLLYDPTTTSGFPSQLFVQVVLARIVHNIILPESVLIPHSVHVLYPKQGMYFKFFVQ